METLYRRIMTREWYTFEPIKIDTLQRYKSTPDDFCTMQASWEWEYIKYSELKKLLED